MEQIKKIKNLMGLKKFKVSPFDIDSGGKCPNQARDFQLKPNSVQFFKV